MSDLQRDIEALDELTRWQSHPQYHEALQRIKARLNPDREAVARVICTEIHGAPALYRSYLHVADAIAAMKNERGEGETMTTETNTPHPNADLLRAIADGRQVQCCPESFWRDITAREALDWIASGSGHKLRIKPRTRKVKSWVRVAWFKDIKESVSYSEVNEENADGRERALEACMGFGQWLCDRMLVEAEVEDDHA